MRSIRSRSTAFLTYGYVPAPDSILTGVKKLMPAHTLVWHDGQTTISRYWRLDFSKKLQVTDPRELHEPIREAIRTATRRRMIADVDIGAFLSGGIDSSAVVAAMSEASSAPVKTFSIGFDHEDFDELPHARRIAQLFGTEHEEFVVRSDAIDLVPRIVRQYGEPFADPSAIPCFQLAELTRRHVTVALNGDGGDEAFGGYTRYVANRLAGRLDGLPAFVKRAGAAPAATSAAGIRAARRIRPGGCCGASRPTPRTATGATWRGLTGHSARRSTRIRFRRRADTARRRRAARGLGADDRERCRRQDARGRRHDVPARGPDHEGRHRDDGVRAGGALAAARPRTARVRRLDSGGVQGARPAEEMDPSRVASRLAPGRDPRSAQAGLLGPGERLVPTRARRHRPERAAGSAIARSRLLPARRSRSDACPPPCGNARRGQTTSGRCSCWSSGTASSSTTGPSPRRCWPSREHHGTASCSSSRQSATRRPTSNSSYERWRRSANRRPNGS